MELSAGTRDGWPPTTSPSWPAVEMHGVTSDQLLPVLASALIGFAAIVARYHLPSLVPALRRAVDRDRR